MTALTHERLTHLLDYDPMTGVFRWKRTKSHMKPGSVAGCIQKGVGYRLIGIDCHQYGAARLAYFYCFGVWPNPEVDHINGDRADNRITNLREVARRENQQNRTEARRGHLPGTCFHKSDKRAKPWAALIQIDGRKRHLGYFKTATEARHRYLQEIDAMGGF